MEEMKYTAVIRTLGTAGEKYQSLLNSLIKQTIPPSAILVYIAEGYPIPKETVGVEQYIYVKKGMVAQRALPYEEVETEYMLFLDDDVYLPPKGVETLYREMVENHAQVISPCVFANHQASVKRKILLSLLGREVCRVRGKRWGFKVLRNAGFSYRNNPVQGVYESQTNAGPCFFCRKEDFLKIKYEEENWLEGSPYAFPDDQVMFYKMYKKGLKQLTSFDSGILHLDASSTVSNNQEKTVKLIYSEYRNKLIFWHRFIYTPEKNLGLKVWSLVCILYVYVIQFLNALLRYVRGQKRESNAYFRGLRDGYAFIRSEEYRKIPAIGEASL